jgi:hypothetical protein
MQLAAEGVGLHADPDQIVGAEHLQGLSFGQRHEHIILTEKHAPHRKSNKTHHGGTEKIRCEYGASFAKIVEHRRRLCRLKTLKQPVRFLAAAG